MKTYLVTGAAGFIGSKLAEKLMSEGNRVVTIDNLSTGHLENIPKGVEFIKGGCQNPEIINKLRYFNFDTIFHIAGQSSGEISFEDPIYDLQTNTQSTLLLLKLCIESNCKKFIYASTMSVYGDQKVLPVNESSPTFPKSLYGVGKLASENYLRIYSSFGIQATALRLFNVFGAGQNLDNLKQGMVSIFIAQALKHGKVVVKGSSERFRDFVHIDDVVNAFCQVQSSIFSPQFHVYNVCSGNKTKVGELLNIINELSGGQLEIEFVGNTLGDQFGITGSYDKLKSAYGWAPVITLEEGLRNMFNWAKNSL